MSHIEPIPFDMPDTEMEAQVPEQFAVHDEASANWVVRKIVGARAYAERVQSWAEQEAQRARREERFFLGRFGLELNRWLRQQLTENGGRAKSVNLPAGRVGLRTAKPRLVVDDETAAMNWAKSHCADAVTVAVSERLLKQPLHDHFAETGELPDGTRLEPEHDNLYIK